MEEPNYHRSLTNFPSIVVAYFDVPKSPQTAIDELRGLGFQPGDIHVVQPTVAKTEAVVTPTSAGFVQQLTSMIRSLFGQASKPAPAPSAPEPSSLQTTVIVQASRLPNIAVAEILQRHGASQVDSRAEVQSAMRLAKE